MKYINQLGTKTLENNHNSGYLCTSCKYNVKLYKLPSFKSTKRCTIYYHKTESVQFQRCKFYNPKRKTSFIIGV